MNTTVVDRTYMQSQLAGVPDQGVEAVTAVARGLRPAIISKDDTAQMD